MKKIACKVKIWFYIIKVLLFSWFMSNSNFFFHVPCERSTFPWLCGWDCRLFLTRFLIASKDKWHCLIQERKFLQIWLDFFLTHTVNKKNTVNSTVSINTCFDKKCGSTKLFKINVTICQKMNWEAWLRRENVSLTQLVSQILSWLCRTS